MAEPATAYNDLPEIDISHLVTEDDEPVDNLYSERQRAAKLEARLRELGLDIPE